MARSANPKLSYCRQCGGERHHDIVGEHKRLQTNDEADISWGQLWQILECRGCMTVSAVSEEWNSEDLDRGQPEITRQMYPPSPQRKLPEWDNLLFLLNIPMEAAWLPKLHQDIYSALSWGAFGLAAMGTRTIIDYIVTSQVGDTGNFQQKLKRMAAKGLITKAQVGVIYAAYDAGSAAGHRGFDPEPTDVNTLLDITEYLMEKTYIEPARQRRHAAAADDLKARTPR